MMYTATNAARIRYGWLDSELWNAWASGRKLDPKTLAARLDPEVAERLKALLRERIANPEGGENAALWTNLRKGLPDHPHQAQQPELLEI